MSKLLIENATIVLPDKLLQKHCVLCTDGKISEIGEHLELCDSDFERFDAQGSYLAPGFIDLHIHGIGHYLVDHGPVALAKICELLPKYGVTGFLPTVCPLPAKKDVEFLHELSTTKTKGTQILGFHLEGPFLSKTGALPKDALGAADPERVQSLIDAGGDYGVVFSISPEFENVTELIEIMKSNNKPVFMTHTQAGVQETLAAIKAGACHATHFYDVFYAPEETDGGVRPCGAVEAILADKTVTVDFILDGEHVDPIAIKMALVCKGPEGVCLITDANIGTGLLPDRYKALGTEIEFAYPGAPARMTENTPHPGSLVGSGLTMDRSLRNAVKMLNLDLPQAVSLVSANPAKVLRLKNKGQIRLGFDADLTILDQELNVVRTYVKGRCCYRL